MKRARTASADEGFTLIELLVGMLLLGLVMSTLFAGMLGARNATRDTKQLNDVNQEARLALVRMSRELRQARSIDAASLFTTGPYAAAGYAFSLTLSADFNGNGTIEPNAVDPETLTYRYVADPSVAGNGRIELVANDASGTAVVRPILSAHVSDFRFELRSSQWQCDANGDGVTTWQELDTNANAGCPHPDGNSTLDLNELSRINSVVIAFSVFEGSHKQDYRSQVDLRNVGV